MRTGKSPMDLVVKDNALINASYNLSLIEQRLILMGIVNARESGAGIALDTPLVIHASAYEKQFNTKKSASYQALKDATSSLFERQFSFTETTPDGKLKVIRSRWVSQIAYIDDSAEVQIIFTPALVSMITRLESHFSSYDLEQIANLSSKYAVRLYELVMAWQATGKTPVFEISDFRNKLGLLDDEYSTMSNFKKYVLELAIAQINEHTDIKLDYQQHKSGRTISGFSFKFKVKAKQQKIEQQRDPNTIDLFSKMTDAQRYLFGNKLAHDARVQSDYSHLIGTGSYEDFGRLLADMLAEEKHFKMFQPLLVELGFK